LKSIRFILPLIVLLNSCSSNSVYEDTKSFADNTWKEKNTAVFNVKNIDTVSNYNINFILRNTNDYEFSSIYLIAKIIKPNKTIETDTLEYLMANPDGSWLGTGNSIKESWLAYKQNYKFGKAGDYKIMINQANRKNGNIDGVKNLKGLTDIGIQITKSEK